MAILAFHNIEYTFPLGVNYYSPTRFKRLLSFLLDSGDSFVALGQYLQREDNRNAIALTFDDGYLSFYDAVWPILKAFSVPATIFVPYNYIGKDNDWDYMNFIRKSAHLDINRLKKLAGDGNIEIGSHGMNHRSLSNMADRLLMVELEHSRKGLEDIIDRPVRFISFPFGRFDSRTERFALKAGYLRGFSLSHFSRGNLGFTLPRFSIGYHDTPYSVLQKIGGGPLAGLEKAKGAILNSYSSGTILLNRIRSRGERRTF
ncbi:putative Polysaccharide deacetylase [Candidatus Zixiibacteriota bacterium]|nr:putative Polysaccharide deacetylase [candidate division Zixibacteria bacterium]